MISFLTSLFLSLAIASTSTVSTVFGKVIIVDVDKIVITTKSRRIEIPAKYVKEKYKVGDEAHIKMPTDDIPKLRSEALPPKK